MEELLDLVRNEPVPASTYFDETCGSYVTVDLELRDRMFERFQYLHTTINSQQYEIRSRFLFVGACLAEIERDKLYGIVRQNYGIVGYSSFYEFCATVFGFGKTTVKNLVAVYREFCNSEGLLRVEYTNFSYSQLVELSTMENYRERIPVACSVRNIRRLKELYREYVPHGGTYEDDLKEWQRRHDEKLALENAQKNKISFIPAKIPSDASGQTSDHGKSAAIQPDFGENSSGQTSDRPESSAIQPNFSESDADDVADEREEITPNVPHQVSFEQIRDGLLRQLNMLHDVIGWKSASEVVMNALQYNRPVSICRTVDVIRLIQEKDALVRENEEIKHCAVRPGTAASGALNLKNKADREAWLRDFRSWGVWLEVPELSLTYYRYEFKNGAKLTVTVGIEYCDSFCAEAGKHVEMKNYSIQDDVHNQFDLHGVSFSYVIDWLSKHAKEL